MKRQRTRARWRGFLLLCLLQHAAWAAFHPETSAHRASESSDHDSR
jgi:hypothetical protein